MSLICPGGMKLVKPDSAKHPGEKPFCMMEAEVTQAEDQQFWATKIRSGFELLVKLVSGKQTRETGQKERPLREKAAKEIDKPTVSTVTVQSVVKKRKRHLECNLVGPKKPTIYRNWHDARTYCRSVYPGGDLPTERQWKMACGDGMYCTASGKKSKLSSQITFDLFNFRVFVANYPL